MQSEKLDIQLDDKFWFRLVNLPEKDALTPTSKITTPVVTKLFRLNLGIELLFAIALVALALYSHVWVEEDWVSGLFYIYIPLFLGLWLLRKVLIWQRYGFNYKAAFEVSKDELTIVTEPLSKQQQLTMTKADIDYIQFSYGYMRSNGQGYQSKQSHISQAVVVLKNNELYTIKPNTIATLNLLYLCIYFDYPVSYKYSLTDGGGSVVFILLRVMSMGGNFVMIGLYLYWMGAGYLKSIF